MYGGLSEVIKPLSDDVVARLAALDPPIVLSGGMILLSRKHVYEAGAPNRIVMIPAKSTFGAKDTSSASRADGSSSAEMHREGIQRAIATEYPALICQCWGQANPPDPDYADFDVAQALYRTVIASAHALVSGGRIRITDGAWLDQKSDGTQLDVAGHVFEFGVEFDCPVTDTIGSYAVNPKPVPTAYYQAPGGTPAPA